MWLYRGAQSAIFYYATCTPCANSINHRKRKKDAARSQREKEKIEAVVTDQPRPFPQPTPFSTNQGWMEEIALGPGPPRRRGGHRTNTCHRRTDSWDTDLVSAVSFHDHEPGNSNTPSELKDKVNAIGDRWNRMLRYQREDEPLWGEEMEVKGSSIGFSGRGRVDTKSPSKYYIPRVPPVNDLHPPIVSGPKSRAETRWMLQPPPSAKVMAGKERSDAPTLAVNYGSLRADIDKSTRRTIAQPHQLPPLTTQNVGKKSNPLPPLGLRSPTTPEPQTNNVPIPRQPSPAFFAYGRDESNFVISHSTHSLSDSCSTLSSLPDSEMESPRISIQSPQTPTSRPASKATNDNFHTSRPTITKSLSTVHRDTKKVQLLQLELSDSHNDVEVGQLERIRPFRWSMDI